MTEPKNDFAPFFPFAAKRLKPEVLHALKVILGAIFEDARIDDDWKRTEEVRAHRDRRDRIARAERGVATRRRNAKKKKKVGGVVKKKRPVQHRTKKAKRK